MNQEDKQLLNNVFDSLDRLFDRESRAIDLYQLLYATDKAFEDNMKISLASYVIELGEIVRDSEPEETQRERALKVTNTVERSLPVHTFRREAV